MDVGGGGGVRRGVSRFLVVAVLDRLGVGGGWQSRSYGRNGGDKTTLGGRSAFAPPPWRWHRVLRVAYSPQSLAAEGWSLSRPLTTGVGNPSSPIAGLGWSLGLSVAKRRPHHTELPG